MAWLADSNLNSTMPRSQAGRLSKIGGRPDYRGLSSSARASASKYLSKNYDTGGRKRREPRRFDQLDSLEDLNGGLEAEGEYNGGLAVPLMNETGPEGAGVEGGDESIELEAEESSEVVPSFAVAATLRGKLDRKGYFGVNKSIGMVGEKSKPESRSSRWLKDDDFMSELADELGGEENNLGRSSPPIAEEGPEEEGSIELEEEQERSIELEAEEDDEIEIDDGGGEQDEISIAQSGQEESLSLGEEEEVVVDAGGKIAGGSVEIAGDSVEESRGDNDVISIAADVEESGFQEESLAPDESGVIGESGMKQAEAGGGGEDVSLSISLPPSAAVERARAQVGESIAEDSYSQFDESKDPIATAKPKETKKPTPPAQASIDETYGDDTFETPPTVSRPPAAKPPVQKPTPKPNPSTPQTTPAPPRRTSVQFSSIESKINQMFNAKESKAEAPTNEQQLVVESKHAATKSLQPQATPTSQEQPPGSAPSSQNQTNTAHPQPRVAWGVGTGGGTGVVGGTQHVYFHPAPYDQGAPYGQAAKIAVLEAKLREQEAMHRLERELMEKKHTHQIQRLELMIKALERKLNAPKPPPKPEEPPKQQNPSLHHPHPMYYNPYAPPMHYPYPPPPPPAAYGIPPMASTLAPAVGSRGADIFGQQMLSVLRSIENCKSLLRSEATEDLSNYAYTQYDAVVERDVDKENSEKRRAPVALTMEQALKIVETQEM